MGSPGAAGSARAGPASIGSSRSVSRIAAANTRKTDDQGMTASRRSAASGPTTCPAEPAAEATPSAIDRRSGATARPMMARISPKPVPAMPNPISTL